MKLNNAQIETIKQALLVARHYGIASMSPECIRQGGIVGSWNEPAAVIQDYVERFRELSESTLFEDGDLVLDTPGEQQYEPVQVTSNYRNSKLAHDNEALMKWLEKDTVQEMLSHYIFRGVITYAQSHHMDIDDVEIEGARWGANDEFIIRFNRDP